MSWLLRRLIKLDVWTNKNLENGYKGETLSSQGGKALLRWLVGPKQNKDIGWCMLCRFLDLFQKHHCLLKIQPDHGESPVIWPVPEEYLS